MELVILESERHSRSNQICIISDIVMVCMPQSKVGYQALWTQMVCLCKRGKKAILGDWEKLKNS